jgi:hypothetical protein
VTPPGISSKAAASDDHAHLVNQRGELREADAGAGDWPGLKTSLTVLSSTFIGDGLRDALDPRIRGCFSILFITDPARFGVEACSEAQNSVLSVRVFNGPDF